MTLYSEIVLSSGSAGKLVHKLRKSHFRRFLCLDFRLYCWEFVICQLAVRPAPGQQYYPSEPYLDLNIDAAAVPAIVKLTSLSVQTNEPIRSTEKSILTGFDEDH